MRAIMIGALRASLVTWVLCGIAYPLALTSLGQWLMPIQANGSLERNADGIVIGSRLIGQSWNGPEWFHGRPSVTTDTDPNDPAKTVPAPYNAASSRASNLGPTSKDLLQCIPSDWQAEASHLLSSWEQAVRASSAVENWHSIVRPHLAVHRTLSAGMLALLAVWHNHRIAPRGLHEGLSPLQRTGSPSPEAIWLAALGYSALAA